MGRVFETLQAVTSQLQLENSIVDILASDTVVKAASRLSP
jgi:hypothetical protein